MAASPPIRELREGIAFASAGVAALRSAGVWAGPAWPRQRQVEGVDGEPESCRGQQSSVRSAAQSLSGVALRTDGRQTRVAGGWVGVGDTGQNGVRVEQYWLD